MTNECLLSPCHMMILNPFDNHWEDYFNQAEIQEIKVFSRRALPNMPNELKAYIDSYKNKIF